MKNTSKKDYVSLDVELIKEFDKDVLLASGEEDGDLTPANYTQGAFTGPSHNIEG